MPQVTQFIPAVRTVYACARTQTLTATRLNITGRSRSTVSKRVKPVGVNQLFSPTSLTVEDYGCVDGGVSYSYDTSCYDSQGIPRLSRASVSGPAYGDVGFGLAPDYFGTAPSNTRILAEIKQQGVNMAMMLAEYRQAASMFETAADSLVALYRGIRQGLKRNLLAAGVRSAPSTWLLYRYGVTPLIYDMKAIRDLLDGVRNDPLVRSFKVKHPVQHSWEVHNMAPSYAPSGTYVKRFTQQRVRYIDVAHVEYENTLLRSFSSLGFLNPIELTWELIPYSFIWDWFFNIGDTIAALDALTGTVRTSATRTRRSQVQQFIRSSKSDRNVYSRIPLGLALQAPRWEPSLNWKRLVDSIALAKQRSSPYRR